MTLLIIAEDGTGTADPPANVYEDVAATEERLVDMGYTAFEASADKEAAVFRGTQSVEATIRGQLTGERRIEAQGLNYPRVSSYYQGHIIRENVIPGDLLLACALRTEAEAILIAAGNQPIVGERLKRQKFDGVGEKELFESTAASRRAEDAAARHVRALIQLRSRR